MCYDIFGVMLDCSRNGVLNVPTVKRMINCLEKMGYNALELYTEDTYELPNEPYFGYLRGRYTSVEIKEIDAYAKAHGVELIPCIQTLGHFSALVKNSAYNDIIDTADILLIDEEKTYEFLDKIFATLAENFSSRKINIGMDEAHTVGLGKYLDRHGYVNRFELLLRHLKRVCNIAEKYGFKPHMWSDMFFRLVSNGEYYNKDAIFSKDILQCVPENVALAFWDYYHDDPELYDGMFDKHFEFNREVWFAGGVWTWYGPAPLSTLSLRYMQPAIRSAIKKGVKNMMFTMWGDNGKECSFFTQLHILYELRQNALGNFDKQSIKDGFYKLFGVSYDDFMLLELPNVITPERVDEDATAKMLLYSDLFMGISDKLLQSLPSIPYSDYAIRTEKAIARSGEFKYLFENSLVLCKLLSVKAELGIETRNAYRKGDKVELASLINDYNLLCDYVEDFHGTLYQAWIKENKPQGWEVHDSRLGGLIMRIKTCAKRLQDYIDGNIDEILELEEELLSPYRRFDVIGHNSIFTRGRT